MKIVLTGGGSGGHFYPLIAVAEKINEIAEQDKLLTPELYYFSDKPYDKKLLYDNNITFKKISAGKLRRYFSVLNFFDLFKTGWGMIKAFFLVFKVFPDVVFSNGGNLSFPVLLSARLFKIPVFIHISDSIPGRTNAWAAKFAKKISLGFPEASEFLTKEKEKIAVVGNPVRKDLMLKLKEGANEFLHLSSNIPTILVLGGSGGSQIINESVVDILPELVKDYQIIHQIGDNLFQEIKGRAEVVLEKSEFRERYKPFPYLNTLSLRMSAGVAELIISRAGAGSLSEIALWGIPSIVIPIPEEISGDQTKNAFSFASSQGAVVIEQNNLTRSILLSEIRALMNDPKKRKLMGKQVKKFARPEAAQKIAQAILDMALEHEK